MALSTASMSLGSQSKSGKPWPRFTAPRSCASADITVKMVVPTWGRRLSMCTGVVMAAKEGVVVSEVVVLALAGHGARDERACQAVGEQLGEGVDEVAQVGAALEGHARDVLPEQVAGRAPHQLAAGGVVPDRHLGHDAHAEAQLDIGLDDVG